MFFWVDKITKMTKKRDRQIMAIAISFSRNTMFSKSFSCFLSSCLSMWWNKCRIVFLSPKKHTSEKTIEVFYSIEYFGTVDIFMPLNATVYFRKQNARWVVCPIVTDLFRRFVFVLPIASKWIFILCCFCGKLNFEYPSI